MQAKMMATASVERRETLALCAGFGCAEVVNLAAPLAEGQ